MRGIDLWPRTGNGRSDLETLLHPAQAFDQPHDVVHDPDLTLNEKRAILASWASDLCAVEAAPALHRLGARRPVQFDHVMDALRSLDHELHGVPPPRPGSRRRFRRRGGRSHGRLV